MATLVLAALAYHLAYKAAKSARAAAGVAESHRNTAKDHADTASRTLKVAQEHADTTKTHAETAAATLTVAKEQADRIEGIYKHVAVPDVEFTLADAENTDLTIGSTARKVILSNRSSGSIYVTQKDDIQVKLTAVSKQVSAQRLEAKIDRVRVDNGGFYPPAVINELCVISFSMQFVDRGNITITGNIRNALARAKQDDKDVTCEVTASCRYKYGGEQYTEEQAFALNLVSVYPDR